MQFHTDCQLSYIVIPTAHCHTNVRARVPQVPCDWGDSLLHFPTGCRAGPGPPPQMLRTAKAWKGCLAAAASAGGGVLCGFDSSTLTILTDGR